MDYPHLAADTIPEGVGASVLCVEDDRHLRGQGEFVADLRLPGMQNLAFVRSLLARAHIRAIRKPPGAENQVFTAADLAGVGPIVANSTLPGFKPSAQHALATDRVRHVGEAVAVCVAPTRAAAEDLAEQVVLDLEELPAVSDMLARREEDAPPLHPHWGDNVFLETLRRRRPGVPGRRPPLAAPGRAQKRRGGEAAANSWRPTRRTTRSPCRTGSRRRPPR